MFAMSGNFFRGTSANQDTRFSNKEAKLLKSQKFAPELDEVVDMAKVNMDVMKPWIARRVTEILGVEDEVLINFIYGLLEDPKVSGKAVQIHLTGFMEKNTGKFMKELWGLLLTAQRNISGIPQQFLDEKAEETRRKREEGERILLEIGKRKNGQDGPSLEQHLKLGMDIESAKQKAAEAAARLTAGLLGLPIPPPLPSLPESSQQEAVDVKAELAKAVTVEEVAIKGKRRSPHPRSPERYRRSPSRSKSPADNLLSRSPSHSSRSASPRPLRRRPSYSPPRRSFQPRRHASPSRRYRSPPSRRNYSPPPLRRRSPPQRYRTPPRRFSSPPSRADRAARGPSRSHRSPLPRTPPRPRHQSPPLEGRRLPPPPPRPTPPVSYPSSPSEAESPQKSRSLSSSGDERTSRGCRDQAIATRSRRPVSFQRPPTPEDSEGTSEENDAEKNRASAGKGQSSQKRQLTFRASSGSKRAQVESDTSPERNIKQQVSFQSGKRTSGRGEKVNSYSRQEFASGKRGKYQESDDSEEAEADDQHFRHGSGFTQSKKRMHERKDSLEKGKFETVVVGNDAAQRNEREAFVGMKRKSLSFKEERAPSNERDVVEKKQGIQNDEERSEDEDFEIFEKPGRPEGSVERDGEDGKEESVEAKQRRKDEKRARKEVKRKRKEEKRKRKEARRLAKEAAGRANDESEDEGEVGERHDEEISEDDVPKARGSVPELKLLEEELRRKALESLKMKRQKGVQK